MTNSEIAAMASSICTAHDACPADGRAMLHQIAHDHGRAVAVAVTAMCRMISRRRCEEVALIFEGLPPDISFAAALAVKRERGEPCAQGWTKQSDGTFAKLVRT
ncbi:MULTISPECIES: hypothetical protein [unclassified Bradyrhizobium]|uniref:hypothetical protein n=1 Tax=unclassified Bradyrhizobium TaxID=2631580 RepID=UPI001FFA3218|nr:MULTISPECIES: hypothetical protein [unclassified Bradyrhizobium]MCK1303898.1 hypothetical protein [Bradyrhizobium sp. 37]MCK1770416.1 hypothetical protein [Bradyrhizobium sp. 134]